MRQRTAILICVFVGTLGLAAYGFSPYFAMYSLRNAAISGDRDRIEQIVDFPAVRESLKSQISAGLMKSMSADPQMRDNPFAAIGTLLAPAITDRMVDGMVTPDAISALLSKGQVVTSGSPPKAEEPSARGDNPVKTTLSYRTLDRFRADLQVTGHPETAFALTLERRGLFSWKLIRLDIPPSIFDPSAKASPASAAPVAAQPVAPSPLSEGVPTDSGPTDSCRAIAEARVASIEDPNSILVPGQTEDFITEYVVDKKSGNGSFCSHGGYCYPRYASVNDKKIEVLRLENCHILDPSSGDDAEQTIYSIGLDIPKN